MFRLLNALLAFLALPGVVVFALPLLWLVSQQAHLQQAFGLLPGSLGLCILLVCTIDFYRWGHGTLAPWAPPEQLVLVRLYRWSRNPMYLGVLLMLVGWAWGSGDAALWIYAGCCAVGFHLRVVLREEPWLERRYGAAWRDYAARVRRWL